MSNYTFACKKQSKHLIGEIEISELSQTKKMVVYKDHEINEIADPKIYFCKYAYNKLTKVNNTNNAFPKTCLQVDISSWDRYQDNKTQAFVSYRIGT